jgi:hypothetical protein
MIAVVAKEDGAPRATVADPANLRQLHAEFRGVDDPAAADALRAAGLGTVREGHAWLSTAALRAAGDGSAEWTQRFDRMIAYAVGQGWVSADGSEVQAHIERMEGDR